MKVLEIIKLLWRGPKLVKDEGYAWVVLFLSTLSHAVNFGFSIGVVGTLTVAQLHYFKIDIDESALIGSLHMGFALFAGTLGSLLVKRLRCRLSLIIGGVLVTLGVGLTAFTTEAWQAIFLFGVIAGTGISICYMTSAEILVSHFERYKYFAFSVVFVGLYFGRAVVPVLSEYLLETYGYSKTMGILSTFHVIHIVSGILFFEPSIGMSDVNSEETVLLKEVNASSLYITDQTSGAENHCSVKGSAEEAVNEQADGKNSSADDDTIPNNLPAILKALKELLISPKTWGLIISGLLWNINLASFYILINDFILEKTTMNGQEVALGIAIVGIFNVLGCLTIVATSTLQFERLKVHFITILFFAVATILMAFTNGKVMYYALASLVGLGEGAMMANALGTFHEYCGTKNLALILGLHEMAEGIGGIAGPPLVDLISNYSSGQYAIIFAGGSGVAGACCIIPILVSNYRNRRKEKLEAAKPIDNR